MNRSKGWQHSARVDESPRNIFLHVWVQLYETETFEKKYTHVEALSINMYAQRVYFYIYFQ